MRGDTGAGWASRSLDDSLQQAEAAGIAVWQIVNVYAVFASEVSIARWLVVMAHLVVCAVAVVIATRRQRAWPLLLLNYALLPLDYRAVVDADSALCFIALWTSLLMTGIPVLLLPGRHAWPFSLLAVTATAAPLLVWHADWGVKLPVVTTLTALALMVAAWVLMKTLRAFAGDADAQEVLAAREREQLLLRRTVARAAAEDARVMHDTLINTLSAIASGSNVMKTDAELVRERCARDVEAVEAILDGQGSKDTPGFQLTTTAVPPNIKLRRTGLTDDELDRWVSQLPTHVVRAVQGAVQELIRNAAKHSGSDRVTLDVGRKSTTLTIMVSDEGRGFDGRLIAGRGLAESVLARARDVGVDVAIRTERGAGTTVALTIALDDHPAAVDQVDGASDTGRIVEQIRRTACWRWAMIMVGFGLASVLIRQPAHVLLAYGALTVVGGLSVAAWSACPDERFLPRWMTALVLLAIPLSFLTGLGSIDFGRSDVSGWPTVVITALPVVLLVTRQSRTAFFIGIGLIALTAAVTTYVVWRTAPSAATVIPAGAATQLAVLTAWLALHQVIDDIGAQHQRTQHKLAEDRVERVARDRIIAARARWTNAGARTSLEILRRIAAGEIDPADRHVQSQCAEAERYLRQVLLLNPEIVHMSPWIGRAMADARSKSVSLLVRVCAEDAPNEETAEAFGRVILASVDALPSGAELGLGLCAGDHGPRLLLVASAGSLAEIPAPAGLPDTSTFTYRHLGAQDLVELAVIRPGDEPPTGGRRRGISGSPDPQRTGRRTLDRASA